MSEGGGGGGLCGPIHSPTSLKVRVHRQARVLRVQGWEKGRWLLTEEHTVRDMFFSQAGAGGYIAFVL